MAEAAVRAITLPALLLLTKAAAAAAVVPRIDTPLQVAPAAPLLVVRQSTVSQDSQEVGMLQVPAVYVLALARKTEDPVVDGARPVQPDRIRVQRLQAAQVVVQAYLFRAGLSLHPQQLYMVR